MPYTANSIKDLDATTPTEGGSYIPELNDSDREIKRVLKNQFAIATKSANYTLTESDSIIIANTSGIIITLPAASSVAGGGYTKVYIIKNLSGGDITIAGVIDGEANPTLEDKAMMIIATDGSSWWKSNPYTPPTHASRHGAGGADELTGSLNVKLDDLAAPDDNTDLNVSISAHGLCPKLPDDETLFLNGKGNWAEPGGVEIGLNASNNNKNSNSTMQGTNQNSYTLLKEIRINDDYSGSIRIKWQMRTSNAEYLAYSRLYKNGAPVGTEKYTAEVTFQDFNEDLSGGLAAGDYIQIYGKIEASGAFCYVANMYLAFDWAVLSLGGHALSSPLATTDTDYLNATNIQ